ncbi:DapH/DapD/GlmU-related protein [Lactobacillus sp. PSON]|uniref:DapH/DapD/GlmU-related protein n=1 Tax=Lactobacillus sp. PSON TaxID=3455454 RepID=UPI004041812F
MKDIHQQLIAQNQRLLQNLNTERHCKCEINQLVGEIIGKKVPSSTEIRLPFYTDFGRNIKIGKNVFINSNVMLVDEGEIEIDDNVQIGSGVQILSADPTLYTEKIIIKKGAKIGSGSIIYPGVVIGRDAKIAPGSVVKQSVKDNVFFNK